MTIVSDVLEDSDVYNENVFACIIINMMLKLKSELLFQVNNSYTLLIVDNNNLLKLGKKTL